MANDRGYGLLENELIDLLHTGEPDFVAVEELIAKGADLNAVCLHGGKNVLSDVISGYWGSKKSPECIRCSRGHVCSTCGFNIDLNPNCGESLIKIIRFFLDHGFDVHKQNDCYGAQCLWELAVHTYDRHMVDGIKLFLDAGARNRTVSEQESESPIECVDTRNYYSCELDCETCRIFEAAYQVYMAAEEGRPYSGIDVYESACGKKITKVLAKKPENEEIFYNFALAGDEFKNCFNEKLYFAFDGGFLVTTQYGEFWTDTILPGKEMIDVSEHFPDIVGHSIEEFSFKNSAINVGEDQYDGQIATMKMSSGMNVIFRANLEVIEQEIQIAQYKLRAEATYRDELLRLYWDEVISIDELVEMMVPMYGKSHKQNEQIAKQFLEKLGHNTESYID